MNIFLLLLLCRHAVETPITSGLHTLIEVVCSDKEARKHLTESDSTPAMDLGHTNVVLK